MKRNDGQRLRLIYEILLWILENNKEHFIQSDCGLFITEKKKRKEIIYDKNLRPKIRKWEDFVWIKKKKMKEKKHKNIHFHFHSFLSPQKCG